MSLKFHLATDQDDRQFVTRIADRGRGRMIAKVARPVIEDAFPDADYMRDHGFCSGGENTSTSLPGLSRRRVAVRDYRRSGDDIWSPHRS